MTKRLSISSSLNNNLLTLQEELNNNVLFNYTLQTLIFVLISSSHFFKTG